MYETRLPGSGGRAKGLTGLGGPSRGPLDVVLNGAVGLLLAYLVFTTIEPFWVGAIESTREVKLDTDRKAVMEAMGRFKLRTKRPYKDTSLAGLKEVLSKIPDDPWGQAYVVDPVFRRVVSGGEDKAIGEHPEDPEALDDRRFYYRHPYEVLVVIEEPGGERVPYVMNMDGTSRNPIAGDYLPGVMEDAVANEGAFRVHVAAGADGSPDLAIKGPGDPEYRWLVTGPGPARSPSFDADARFVYFSDVRTTPDPLLYRVPVGGGEPEALTAVPDSFEYPDWKGDHHPHVSAASGHLVFDSSRDKGVATRRICFLPRALPGKRVRVLPDSFPPGTRPRWSKDGKSVRYLSADRKTLLKVGFPPKPGSLSKVPLQIAADLWAYSEENEQVLVADAPEPGKARVTLVDPGMRESRTALVVPGTIVALAVLD